MRLTAAQWNAMCVNGTEGSRTAWERPRVAWHRPVRVWQRICMEAKIVATNLNGADGSTGTAPVTVGSLSSSIREWFHKQWECTRAPAGGIRVRTPYMYPDGDILDLFVLEDGTRYRLTDFGETVAWLRMRTGSAKLSPKRRAQINDTCQTHGVVNNRNQLELENVAASDLPRALVQLAAAAARVSDLWFTFPCARFRGAPTMADKHSS